jgi:hypothetical protein
MEEERLSNSQQKGRMAQRGTFGTKGRLAGEPKRQRDSEDGVETIEIKRSAAGSSLSGIEVVWADATKTFISTATILENYDSEDYWSVVFTVASNAFTKVVAYDAVEELYDDTGTSQTKYRLRVVTLNAEDTPVPVTISAYGQYRETLYCHNGELVTSLVKIS